MSRVIVIAGKAGSGKDTVANHLASKLGYTRVGFADPMKRFCADLFGWDDERLFGSSELRNAPDPAWDGLTARHALQTLGTEWGREQCHPEVWIRYAWRTCARLEYRAIISDCRYPNEVEFFRRLGACTILLEGSARPLDGGAAAHTSEQTEWLRGAFDVVIQPVRGVPALLSAVDTALASLALRS